MAEFTMVLGADCESRSSLIIDESHRGSEGREDNTRSKRRDLQITEKAKRAAAYSILRRYHSCKRQKVVVLCSIPPIAKSGSGRDSDDSRAIVSNCNVLFPINCILPSTARRMELAEGGKRRLKYTCRGSVTYTAIGGAWIVDDL